MLSLNVKTDMAEALKALANFESQIPFATAKGLTKTAQDVREVLRAEMRKVFKNPTPYTLNSLYLRPATKARLEAEVWLKYGSRPEHYLLPQIAGGSRPMKRFEQRLQMMGLMRTDQRAVPAAGAKLDAYGNMSRGQIVQVLSQLRTDVVSGVTQNASNSKRSKAKRSGVEYFVSRGPSSQRYGYAGRSRGTMFMQHLPAGVWARYSFAWGSAVKPVMIFVNATRYSKRFDFFGLAEKTVNAKLPWHIEASVADALRTARLSQQGGLF